ncbi:MAG: glycosyltransferase [Planctomycetota bacterium]
MDAKKILVMPDGNWLAHVSRPFEIAKVLREMGHEVMFAGDGRYMSLPGEAGFQTIRIKTIDPGRILDCARRGRTNPYDYELLKELVEEDLKLFVETKPDLVFGDFRLSLSTSCLAAKLPLAVTINAAWTNYYSVKLRAIEHSSIGRLETKLLGRRIPDWLGIPQHVKKIVLAIDSRPCRRLRREMGLTPCRNMCEVVQGDLNLLTDIPEYAPTRNLPANFQYIGPVIWEPQVPPPCWLDELSPNRPTLYFTMGSTGHARFFQQAIDTFANTEYQCIMTTAAVADIRDAPGNFFVTDYARGSEIMKRSHVVICHGGNGTLYQAMSHGVPIIGIPTMHDQEINLQRAVDLGIGIQLSDLKFQPSHLTEAVKQILAKDTYRQNIQRLKHVLANYNGPQKGAQLINSYLAEGMSETGH